MKTSIGDVMREAYKRGWISTRDGNISIKRDGNIYITPSAIRKYLVVPENIVKIKIPKSWDIKDIEESAVTPSIELDTHWRLQKENRIRAVVHLHPTYTIAAMYAGWDLSDLAKQFPELGRYTKVGSNVPNCPPGSTDLAIMTHMSLVSDGNFDIVGLDRHGVVAVAKCPWDAFEHIERLEHICKIVLASGVFPEQTQPPQEDF